jgi:hypothetical protein
MLGSKNRVKPPSEMMIFAKPPSKKHLLFLFVLFLSQFTLASFSSAATDSTKLNFSDSPEMFTCVHSPHGIPEASAAAGADGELVTKNYLGTDIPDGSMLSFLAPTSSSYYFDSDKAPSDSLGLYRYLISHFGFRKIPISATRDRFDYRIPLDELKSILEKGNYCLITIVVTEKNTYTWNFNAIFDQFPRNESSPAIDKVLNRVSQLSLLPEEYAQKAFWKLGSIFLDLSDEPISSFLLSHALADPMDPSYKPSDLTIDTDSDDRMAKIVGEEIRGSRAYARILTKIKNSISAGVFSQDKQSDFFSETDLFFSIHSFKYRWLAVEGKSREFSAEITLTDIYNFDSIKANYTRPSNIANDLGFISQVVGGIFPYNIVIRLKANINFEQ